MLRNFISLLASSFSFILLSACASQGVVPTSELSDAKINPETVTGHALRWVPAPPRSIPVAVYGIADETGAFKPSEGGQTLSRALTQAPTPLLIKALHDAGNRQWFNVIERENLTNLIKERQIIQEMRQRYLGETTINKEALPALKFAGILIEGAITGYDTNMRTGGVGARYLGVGAFTQYREDSVSVYLRAVSVKTGEVLLSITSEQRVASVALQGDIFRFVAFQKLLEAEAGLTYNQPRHLAVRQALEKAVYGLIVEGAEIGLWEFEDRAAGEAAISHYRENYAPLSYASNDSGLPAEFYESHRRLQERRLAFAQRPQQPAPRAQPVRTQRPAPAQPRPAVVQPAPAPVVEGQLVQPNAVIIPEERPIEPKPKKVAKAEPEIVKEEVVATSRITRTQGQRVVSAPPSRTTGETMSTELRNVAAEIEVARLNTKQRFALGATTAAAASAPPVIAETKSTPVIETKENEIQTADTSTSALEELGWAETFISSFADNVSEAVSTNFMLNVRGQ